MSRVCRSTGRVIGSLARQSHRDISFSGGGELDSLRYTGYDAADMITMAAGSLVSGAAHVTYSNIGSLAVDSAGGHVAAQRVSVRPAAVSALD